MVLESKAKHFKMDSTNLTTKMEHSKQKDHGFRGFQRKSSRVAHRSVREQSSEVLKIASRGVFENAWYDTTTTGSACTDAEEGEVSKGRSDTTDTHNEDASKIGAEKLNEGVEKIAVSPVSPAQAAKKCSEDDTCERERWPKKRVSKVTEKMLSADSGSCRRRFSVRAGPLRLVQSMMGRTTGDDGADESNHENGSGVRNHADTGGGTPGGKAQHIRRWRTARSPNRRTEVSSKMGHAIQRIMQTSGLLSPNGVGGSGNTAKVGVFDCECDADTLFATTSALLEREFYGVIRVLRFREARMRVPVTVASHMALMNIVLTTDSRGEGVSRLIMRRNVCDSLQVHNAEFERFCDEVYTKLCKTHRNVVRPNYSESCERPSGF